ncbi:energy-coupling factor transporter ATP-binding protein EcfA2 [Bradyrhizobium sp. AZCC 2230]
MTAIRIEQLTRTFGAVRAVDNISLGIAHGELFTLLGPSGCGKTTLLRMIAGFIEVESGSISFGDRRHRWSARASPRHRHGVSELRDLSEPYRGRKCRLRAEGEKSPVSRHQVARRQGARAGASCRLWSALATSALGRSAAARGHRPRPRHRARGAPVRRAAVQSRRAAADRDADRDPSIAAGARPDRDLCDA